MMEAACSSVTSVDIKLRTWQYIPEESELGYIFISSCVRGCHNTLGFSK